MKISVTGVVIAIMVTLLPLPGRSSTLIDDCNDFRVASQHTPELMLDTQNPRYFYGDGSRFKCTGPSPCSFYYRLHNVRSFTIYGFFWKDLGRIEAYSSTDGVDWMPITLTSSQLAPTTDPPNDWSSARIVPSDPLPEGTEYVGFTLRSDPMNFFTPQIGKVSIDYDGDDASPGPGGLLVIPAVDGAHLSWYPAAGASGYLIQRRTAKGASFHTVATGVYGTDYVDGDLKPGVKYYYVVKARLGSDLSGASEEVLGVGTRDQSVFDDPLRNWSLAVDHSGGLGFDTAVNGINTLGRTDGGGQTIEYKLSNMTSFAVDVFSRQSDPGDAVSVDASVDGSVWTPVSISYRLAATAGDGWNGAIAGPVHRLPAGSTFVRFHLNAGVDPKSFRISEIRLISSTAR